jgi:hypothetical protein
MTDRMNELTAFEASIAERAAGLSISILSDEDRSQPRVALWGALAWVHRKRDEPTLTYEAYMSSVTPADVMDYLFPDDDEDQAAEVDEDGFPDSDGDGPVGASAGEPAGAAGEAEGAVLSGDGDRPE